MTYINYTKVFIETPALTEAGIKHLSEDEFRGVQALLTVNPEAVI